MAQTIKIKRSGSASATPSSLEHGELAINYADGKIYYKNSSNNIVEFSTSGSFLPLSGGTLTGTLLGTNAAFTGKVAVGNSGVHPSYHFYNNQNSYFNGSVVIDDALSITGSNAALSVAGAISITDGSASAPAIRFSNDTDTGIYRFTAASTNHLGFTVDGQRKAYVTPAGLFSDNNVYVANGAQFRTFAQWTASTGGTGYGFTFTNTADSTTPLTISSDGNGVFAGTLTATKFIQSASVANTFYAGQFSRSGSTTTTPDIWGTNSTFVIGTSSTTEALAFTNANAEFYGNAEISGTLTVSTAGSTIKSPLYMDVQNSTGEGGEITLNGSNSNTGHTLDTVNGSFRIFDGNGTLLSGNSGYGLSVVNGYRVNGTQVITSSRGARNLTLEHGTGGARFEHSDWMYSTDNNSRFYFESGARTFYKATTHQFRNTNSSTVFNVSSLGHLHIASNGDSNASSSEYIKAGGVAILTNARVLQNVSGNVSMFTNDAGYLTSHQSLSGLLPLSGGTLTGQLNSQNINVQNYTIYGVNNLRFNDPGPSEGIKWDGGNEWQIYESPDNQTNASGNLQFASGSGNGTLKATLDTSGNFIARHSSGTTRIGQDGNYGNYGSLGFGGHTNGSNRVFGHYGTGDGLFLASATGRGVKVRTNGGNADNFEFTSGGDLKVAGSTFVTSGREIQNASVASSSSIAPRRRGTASVNNSGYVHAFRVDGDNLASSIRFTVHGTTGSVVINSEIFVSCNHFKDIFIESNSGFYTVLTVKVVSNGNEDFSVYLKTNSANTATVQIEVFPLNNEVITFTSTDQGFTTKTLEHTCEYGKRLSAEDNVSGRGFDIETDGQIDALKYQISGTTVIGADRSLTSINSITSGGNINTTSGGFQINGATVIASNHRITPFEHVIFGSTTGYIQHPSNSSSNAWAYGVSGGGANPGVDRNKWGLHYYNGSAWSNPFYVDTSGNTVFTGEIQGATLDINGNADVTGQVVIVGPGTTGSTLPFNIKDNNATNIFRVRDDGVVLIDKSYLYVTASAGAYIQHSLRARGGITNDGGNALSISSGSSDINFNSKNLTSVAAINTSSTISAGSTIHRGNMTIDSQEIDVSSGDLALDVAGNITLDAGGGNIDLKEGGTTFGRLQEMIGGLGISAGSTPTFAQLISSTKTLFFGHIELGDSKHVRWGNGSGDLQIYHDGSNSYIEEYGTGDLIISSSVIRSRTDDFMVNNAANNEHLIRALNGSSVFLYHDGTERFRTHSYGGSLTGSLAVSQQVWSGGNQTHTAPAYAFNNDTNTGMFRVSSDVLGFANGGTERFRLDSGGAIALNGNFAVLKGNTSNTFTNPQIRFGYSNTQNYQQSIRTRHNAGAGTGNAIDFFLWDSGTDAASDIGTLRVASFETSRGLDIRHGGLEISGNTVINSNRVHLASDGSAAGPSFTFNSDTNTGMFRKSSDVIAFSTGGTERATIDSDGLKSNGVPVATVEGGSTSKIVTMRIQAKDLDSKITGGGYTFYNGGTNKLLIIEEFIAFIDTDNNTNSAAGYPSFAYPIRVNVKTKWGAVDSRSHKDGGFTITKEALNKYFTSDVTMNPSGETRNMKRFIVGQPRDPVAANPDMQQQVAEIQANGTGSGQNFDAELKIQMDSFLASTCNATFYLYFQVKFREISPSDITGASNMITIN